MIVIDASSDVLNTSECIVSCNTLQLHALAICWGMFAPAPPLDLSPGQKQELEALARSGNSTQKVALRCRLLLLAHQGVSNRAIAAQLDLSRPTVLALRAAFIRDGMAAVTGIRRRRRRATVLTAELEQHILNTTLTTRPGGGSPRWSVRRLARYLGVSAYTVHRAWRRNGLKPHRIKV